MLAFARGEHDVLVCTTIIESGLDIPNANTIVIDRADALGLAQLYQLRGRVGRSARRAYAYLLYRKRGAALSDIARKRLQAIFNASELGAGFQIALSDLEIRGAGNILGAEQHGHMSRGRLRPVHADAGRGGRGGEGRLRASRAASRPGRRRSSTCRSTPTCPTTTWPRSRRSWSCTGGWAGPRPSRSWRRSAAELVDRFGAAAGAGGAAARGGAAAHHRRGGRDRVAGARGRPAGGPLRPRLVAGGDRTGAGATRAGRPAARVGRRHHLRLEPAPGPAAGGPRRAWRLRASSWSGWRPAPEAQGWPRAADREIDVHRSDARGCRCHVRPRRSAAC